MYTKADKKFASSHKSEAYPLFVADYCMACELSRLGRNVIEKQSFLRYRHPL